MTDKPITLNFDDCDLIGAEVVETIYNNVRSRLNNMKLLEGDLPYIEVIAMELAMTDKILSDYIPNISHIFIEEWVNLCKSVNITLHSVIHHCSHICISHGLV